LDGRPAVGKPKLGFAVSSGLHELQELAASHERRAETKGSEKYRMSGRLVVEREAFSNEPDLSKTSLKL
jgi:hypothetical protein